MASKGAFLKRMHENAAWSTAYCRLSSLAESMLTRSMSEVMSDFPGK